MEAGPWEWQNHKLKGASGGLCREQGPWQGHQKQRPWQQCLPWPSTWEPASRWVGIRQEVRPCVSEFKSFLGVDLELSYWNVILLGSYNYTHAIHPLPPNPTSTTHRHTCAHSWQLSARKKCSLFPSIHNHALFRQAAFLLPEVSSFLLWPVTENLRILMIHSTGSVLYYLGWRKSSREMVLQKMTSTHTKYACINTYFPLFYHHEYVLWTEHLAGSYRTHKQEEAAAPALMTGGQYWWHHVV